MSNTSQPEEEKLPKDNFTIIAERIGKLDMIIQRAPDLSFAVLIAQVDPDAIGAAAGISGLIKARQKDAKVTIYYAGLVAHAQNRTLMDMVHDLQVETIENFKNDDTQTVILVDSCQINDSRFPQELRDKFRPKIIIDHHNNTEKLESTNDELYIIEQAGSSCTLVTELILGIENMLPRFQFSTLLFIGINNDTSELARSDNRDRQAYAQLSPFIDARQFIRFKDFSFSPAYYDHLQKALQNRVLKSNRLVTGVGEVDSDNGDDLSSIADHLFRMEKTNLVFVWGIVQGKVRVTARAQNTARLEKLLTENFGAEGGAKTSSSGISQGGAMLKLSFPKWSVPRTQEAKAAFVNFLHERFKEIVHLIEGEDFA